MLILDTQNWKKGMFAKYITNKVLQINNIVDPKASAASSSQSIKQYSLKTIECHLQYNS